jgi:hypothetical protein
MRARVDKPNPDAAACVFPDCVAPVTERLELPLCDRHCIKVYRRMQVLLDVTAKHVSPPSALHAPQANLTARRSDTAYIRPSRGGMRRDTSRDQQRAATRGLRCRLAGTRNRNPGGSET